MQSRESRWPHLCPIFGKGSRLHVNVYNRHQRYLNCRGCRWRSTWGWRLCQGRTEASVDRSPLGPPCPTAPTPPGRNQKKEDIKQIHTCCPWRGIPLFLTLLLFISKWIWNHFWWLGLIFTSVHHPPLTFCPCLYSVVWAFFFLSFFLLGLLLYDKRFWPACRSAEPEKYYLMLPK